MVHMNAPDPEDHTMERERHVIAATTIYDLILTAGNIKTPTKVYKIITHSPEVSR